MPPSKPQSPQPTEEHPVPAIPNPPPFRGPQYLPPVSSPPQPSAESVPRLSGTPPPPLIHSLSDESVSSFSVAAPNPSFQGSKYLPPPPSQPQPERSVSLTESTQDSTSVVTPFRGNGYLPPPAAPQQQIQVSTSAQATSQQSQVRLC